MRVIDLARRAKVSPETVRYYSRLGFLAPERDPRSSYKIFSDKDYARLQFIRDARSIGMGIEDIRTVLAASENSRASHPQVPRLLQQHLATSRSRIQTLKQADARIDALVRAWAALPRGTPTGRQIARAIDDWPVCCDRG